MEVQEDCPTGGILVTNSDFENKIVYEHNESDIAKIKMAISSNRIWQKNIESDKSFIIKRFIFPNGTFYP